MIPELQIFERLATVIKDAMSVLKNSKNFTLIIPKENRPFYFPFLFLLQFPEFWHTERHGMFRQLTASRAAGRVMAERWKVTEWNLESWQ